VLRHFVVSKELNNHDQVDKLKKKLGTGSG